MSLPSQRRVTFVRDAYVSDDPESDVTCGICDRHRPKRYHRIKVKLDMLDDQLASRREMALQEAQEPDALEGRPYEPEEITDDFIEDLMGEECKPIMVSLILCSNCSTKRQFDIIEYEEEPQDDSDNSSE